MIRVDELSFSYGEDSVLENVSFGAGRGELCGLFGPNGCGKTTLFKCCLNFLPFRRGRVTVNSHDSRRLGIGEMARQVAYVPQEHIPPFPYLAKEIVLMGRTPHLKGGFGAGARHREKARQAFWLLGIEHLADRAYDRLSSGQRQMVLIARAVAQETRVIFLDEPTSALDFQNQMRIWQVMGRLAKAGTTVLVCTHDPNHVAWFCDRAVVMASGKICAQGEPEKVMTQEVLDAIYGDSCRVGRSGKIRMVLPREVAKRSALNFGP